MTTIELNCAGGNVWAKTDGPISAGMVGLRVTLHFDSGWNGLTKTLVCMTAKDKKAQVLVEDEAVVPWEILEAGYKLYLSVEGRNAAGNLILPGVWANCGTIRESCENSHDKSPSPTEMEQLLNRIAETIRSEKSIASQVAENAQKADAAIEALEAEYRSLLAETKKKYQKPSGGIPEADLSESVREKLNSTVEITGTGGAPELELQMLSQNLVNDSEREFYGNCKLLLDGRAISFDAVWDGPLPNIRTDSTVIAVQYKAEARGKRAFFGRLDTMDDHFTECDTVIMISEDPNGGTDHQYRVRRLLCGEKTIEEIADAFSLMLSKFPEDWEDWTEEDQKLIREKIGILSSDEVRDDLARKANNPESPVAGQWGRVKEIGEDGQPVWETAELPAATANDYGVVRAYGNPSNYVVYSNNVGILTISVAAMADIDARHSDRSQYPITVSTFDYAAKAAMCDGKGPAWTAAEQAAAQQRMGILSVEEVLF